MFWTIVSALLFVFFIIPLVIFLFLNPITRKIIFILILLGLFAGLFIFAVIYLIDHRFNNTPSTYSTPPSETENFEPEKKYYGKYTIEELGRKCIDKKISFCLGYSELAAGLNVLNNSNTYYIWLTDSEKIRFDQINEK